MPGKSPYTSPTPAALYIHDELTQYVRNRFGDDSEALQLVPALFGRRNATQNACGFF